MKRLKKVTVRLSESEYIHLKEQSFITGFKLEPFIRSLIAGCNLKPSPPDSYKDLVRELSAIGNSINQISLYKAECVRGKLLTETDKNLWIVYLHVARQRLKGSPVQGELAAKLTEGLPCIQQALSLRI